MSNLYGVDIIRAYEVSWLSSTGKPEIALLEIFEDPLQANTNTWELKAYLNELNNKTFADLKTIRSEIYTHLKKNPNFGDNYIKLMPRQDFFNIDFNRIPKPIDYPHKIGQGLRFICERTGQPFVGYANIFSAEPLAEDIQQQFNSALQELRNLSCTPRAYCNELFIKRFNQTIAEDFVLSLSLYRRGGMSMQIIRCRKSIDFLEFMHREVLE